MRDPTHADVADRAQAGAAPAPASPPPGDPWVVMQRRMRLASYLVASGLAVEAGTLLWTRPPTFLVFLGVGAVLVALGALVYLVTIARHPVQVAPALPPAPGSALAIGGPQRSRDDLGPLRRAPGSSQA